MRTFRAVPLAALVTLTVLALAACTGGGQQSGRGTTRVRICHATSSESNPFVRNVVDDDAAAGGHDGHANDIIPPFDYLDNEGNSQQYPGKNWGGVGQALYDNECNAVDTEAAATSVPAIAPTTPTTSATTEATSPSTTRTPTTAATTAPSTTEGTTSPPITQSPAPTPAPTTEAPTQTTAAPTTPTTAAGGGSGATPTTPGSPGTTSAVSGNQNQPSDPSATTTPGSGGTGAAGATTTAAGDGLPTTGSDANGPVLVGGLLLGLGVLTALLGRRMAVRPEKD